MSIEIKVPDVGESIQEVQILRWKKHAGDAVSEDEEIVELETDKASIDVPVPEAGVLSEIRVEEGEIVEVGDVLAILEIDGEAADADEHEDKGIQRKSDQRKRKKKRRRENRETDSGVEEDTYDQPAKSTSPKEKRKEEKAKQQDQQSETAPLGKTLESAADDADTEDDQQEHGSIQPTPAARRELRRHGLKAEDIETRGERIRPEDVKRHLRAKKQNKKKSGEQPPERVAENPVDSIKEDAERLVPMSLLRKRIARRLVEAQQNAALLTTFNEVDMTEVKRLRKKFGGDFRTKYDAKLGYMSFFVKAVVKALQEFPELNAEVRENDKIAYRDFQHIGIAIGSSHGLVVPVLRHAEQLSFAEIEQHIDQLARRAEQRELEPDDLLGGTFTISNGGVYGSLLSTPIVNPPQSGVLGMHTIQDRPVVRRRSIVVRPMMYVALSYDHRIVDGKDAVGFLRMVKELLEDPARILLEV